MKRICFLLAMVLAGFCGRAQNEFANQQFYSAFNKIYADGQNGFVLYKGKKTSSVGSFYDIYKTTVIVPGADSGQITIPLLIGLPSARYCMKPAKTYDAAAQKVSRLVEAVKTAYGKPLYEQKKTSQLKNYTYYKTLLYTSASPGAYEEPLFESDIVLDRGLYTIDLTITGKIPQPAKVSKLKADNDIENKLKTVLTDVSNLFANEKMTQKSKDQYSTKYNTRTSFFGIAGEVKETSYDIAFYYYLGADILTDGAEAKSAYEKLKAGGSKAGLSWGAEGIDGTQTKVFTTQKPSGGKEYNVLLSYRNEQYTSSVSLLISRYK